MDNIMRYKGYWAEIRYSEEDDCFWGKVEGLKNMSITFEGQTVQELKNDFKETIDYYLDNCKAANETPEEQCKGSLNVRLGTKLHTQAKMQSVQENISINELIKKAVTMYVNSVK